MCPFSINFLIWIKLQKVTQRSEQGYLFQIEYAPDIIKVFK